MEQESEGERGVKERENEETANPGVGRFWRTRMLKLKASHGPDLADALG